MRYYKKIILIIFVLTFICFANNCNPNSSSAGSDRVVMVSTGNFYNDNQIKLLAYDNPYKFVLWHETIGGGDPDIRKLSYSSNNGKTWSLPIIIPQINLDYTFFQTGQLFSFQATEDAIIFHYSQNKGEVWSKKTIVLLNTETNFGNYAVALDESNNIYLVYAVLDEYEMNFTVLKSSNNGVTWNVKNDQIFIVQSKQTSISWITMSGNGGMCVVYGNPKTYLRYEDNSMIVSNNYGEYFEKGPSLGVYSGILTNNANLYALYIYKSAIYYFKGSDLGRASIINDSYSPKHMVPTIAINSIGTLYIAKNNEIVFSNDGEIWSDPFDFGALNDKLHTINTKLVIDKDDLLNLVWINAGGIHFNRI